VETDTDHNKVVAKGSDGSRVRLQEHHHFTFNANGDVTIEFEKIRASCERQNRSQVPHHTTGRSARELPRATDLPSI